MTSYGHKELPDRKTVKPFEIEYFKTRFLDAVKDPHALLVSEIDTISGYRTFRFTIPALLPGVHGTTENYLEHCQQLEAFRTQLVVEHNWNSILFEATSRGTTCTCRHHTPVPYHKERFEVKYLFEPDNGGGALVEIKRLDIPQDSPKDKLYYWLKLIYDSPWDRVATMQFVKMSSNGVLEERFFSGSILRWSPSRMADATYSASDGTQSMNVEDPKDISERAIILIHQYLDQKDAEQRNDQLERCIASSL